MSEAETIRLFLKGSLKSYIDSEIGQPCQCAIHPQEIIVQNISSNDQYSVLNFGRNRLEN